MKIAISFILISIFQQTTVFTYNPTEKTQNVDYIPSSKELLFRGRNNLTFTSVEGEVLREVLLTTDRIKNLNTLEVITIGNALYLINKSGGIVYKLENDGLIRVDNSYDHKSQMMSSIFRYENKIYRFGGYGFFDARNFFTFFDFQSNEWDVLEIEKQEVPIGSFDSKYFIFEDYFYKIGGKALDPYSRTKTYPLKDIWRFHLKEKKWEHILDFEYFNELTYSKSDFLIGNKFYFENQDQLYAFNLVDKAIEKVKNYPLLQKVVKHHPFFIENDNLFYFVGTFNDKELITVNKYPIKGNLNFEQQITPRVSRTTTKWIIGFILLSVIIFGLKNRKRAKNNKLDFSKKNSIILKEHSINFKRKKIDINTEEYQTLKLFQKSNKISINQIIDLFKSKEVSYSQKLRLKDKMISELDVKIKLLLNTDANQIEPLKNSKDNRIRLYHLIVPIIGKM